MNDQTAVKSNTVIDALKRLERAGSEDSVATQKLRKATDILAAKIVSMTGVDVELPRGYRVWSNGSLHRNWNVARPDEQPKILTEAISVDAHWAFQPTLRGLQRFSSDVADGLLDEIAELLEERTIQNTAGVETLNKSIGS